MRKFLLLILLSLSAPVLAQNQCDKLVHEALEAYGCLDSLKTYPAQLQGQMNSQIARDQSMTDAEKSRFSEAVMKSISADRLIKYVETSMSAGCNPQELTTVLAEIKMPLVQKMRALEASANTPEGAEKLRQYLASPQSKAQPEPRKKLIGDLTVATNSTNALIDVIVETSRGMLEGMGAPPATPDQISDMHHQIEGQAEEQMKITALAIYRDASDEDLQKYVALQQSAALRNFNQSFSKALANGMGAEARVTGAALKQLLDQVSQGRKKTAPQAPAAGAGPVPK
jgi:hypothetical protein